MTDINKVIIIGRLTKTCGEDERSFAVLKNGTEVAKVSIAVNHSKKDATGNYVDEASFFDVTIWGKLAGSLKPYLVKGQQIAVEGFLKQERWEKDGQTFSRVSINAENVQLVGGKKDDKPTPKNTVTQAETVRAAVGGTMVASPSDYPSDIPF